MPIYLGLDCGGSSVRARAVDQEGHTIHEGKGGPANIASTPEAVLLESLRSALVGSPPADYTAACFAGLRSTHEAGRAEMLLRAAGVAGEVRCYPDLGAVLALAPDDADCCVIAGTGSVICSGSPENPRRSGGGGPLLGDDGSAFGIVREAIRILFLEGRNVAPTTVFLEALKEATGADSDGDLIASVYRMETPAATLAPLAPIVAADSADGQDYAVSAIDRSIEALASVTVRHLRADSARADRYVVALAGGLWKAHPAMQRWFEAALNTGARVAGQEIEVRRITDSPVAGAVRLAMEMNR